MSVTGTTVRTTAVSDGTITTQYPFTFQIESVDELGVYDTSSTGVITKLVRGTNYNVTIVTATSGYIQFVTATTAGNLITLVRETDLTQEDSFGTGQSVPSEDYEYALDKLTLISQETNDLIGRVLSVPLAADISDIVLEIPLSSRDGNLQFLAWNTAGTELLAVEAVPTGTLIITPFGGSLVTSADAAAARGLLLAPKIDGSDTFATTGGSGTAYTLSVNTNITALTTGLTVSFRAHTPNTGAATLTVTGRTELATKNLMKFGGLAMAANDILAGQICIAVYDGTQFQCLNVGSVPYAATAGSATSSVSATTAGACTGNAATATVASSCSGNAATATTAAACSGNSATATTAADCSGNSATSTTSGSCSGNSATATDSDKLDGQHGAYYATAASVPTQVGSSFTKIYTGRQVDTGGTGVTFITGLSTCVCAQATAENGAGPALAYITSNTTSTPGFITATAAVAGATIHLTAYGT